MDEDEHERKRREERRGRVIPAGVGGIVEFVDVLTQVWLQKLSIVYYTKTNLWFQYCVFMPVAVSVCVCPLLLHTKSDFGQGGGP